MAKCKVTRHQKGDGSYWVNDARGIPVARVCPLCEDEKTSHIRKEVMENPNYESDEPIEADW